MFKTFYRHFRDSVTGLGKSDMDEDLNYANALTFVRHLSPNSQIEEVTSFKLLCTEMQFVTNPVGTKAILSPNGLQICLRDRTIKK